MAIVNYINENTIKQLADETSPVAIAFLNRQYRMTYRAVITGLLAGGQGSDAKATVHKAHELTVASLAQIQRAEI